MKKREEPNYSVLFAPKILKNATGESSHAAQFCYYRMYDKYHCAVQFIKESLVKEEVNSFFSGKEREHTRFTGNDLQKVVHTDLHSLARKDEIWDVMAEAFGDFFLCCC